MMNGSVGRFGGRVLRGALTAVFLTAAGMKLTAHPFEAEAFARFGYAPWFMVAVGLLQLVGAVLLWTRGRVAHGALLLAVLMIGAVASHLRAGDPPLMPVPALVLLAFLLGLAYARRAELPFPALRPLAA